LIFCEANPEHLYNLRCLFLSFEAISALKINWARSKLVPVGKMDDVGGLAGILGCRVSSLPMKYIGLPLGLHLKQNQLGIVLFKSWNVAWQVERGCICLRVVS
jgi:hypothetical protein